MFSIHMLVLIYLEEDAQNMRRNGCESLKKKIMPRNCRNSTRKQKNGRQIKTTENEKRANV